MIISSASNRANSKTSQNFVLNQLPEHGIFLIVTRAPVDPRVRSNDLDRAGQDLLEVVASEMTARLIQYFADQGTGRDHSPLPEQVIDIKKEIRKILTEINTLVFKKQVSMEVNVCLLLILGDVAFILTTDPLSVAHIRNGANQFLASKSTLHHAPIGITPILRDQVQPDVAHIKLIPQDTFLLMSPELCRYLPIAYGKMDSSLATIVRRSNSQVIATQLVQIASAKKSAIQGSQANFESHLIQSAQQPQLDGPNVQELDDDIHLLVVQCEIKSPLGDYQIEQAYQVKDLLQTLYFFEGIWGDNDALNRLSAIVSKVPMKKGQVLFRQYDPGDTLYLIVSGAIVGDSFSEQTYRAGPFGVVGEIAFFNHSPRTASAICEEDGELLTIKAEHLLPMISENVNDIGIKLLYGVIRALSDKLSTRLPSRQKRDALLEGLFRKFFNRGFIFSGASTAVRELKEFVDSCVGSFDFVMIRGPLGSGRPILASELFEVEGDSFRPFIYLDFSRLAANDLERLIFGDVNNPAGLKNGALYLANHGDLVLDNIECIPISVQQRMVDLMSHGEIALDGGGHPIRLTLRLISICVEETDHLVKSGLLLQSFFELLSKRSFCMTPLRNRRQDLPQIAISILKSFRAKDYRLTSDAVQFITRYDWPGELTQLIDSLKRAARLIERESRCEIGLADLMRSNHESLFPDDMGNAVRIRVPQSLEEISSEGLAGALEEVERRYLQSALSLCSNDTAELATRTRLARSTLYKKMTQLGIPKAEQIKAANRKTKEGRRLRARKSKLTD